MVYVRIEWRTYDTCCSSQTQTQCAADTFSPLGAGYRWRGHDISTLCPVCRVENVTAEGPADAAALETPADEASRTPADEAPRTPADVGPRTLPDAGPRVLAVELLQPRSWNTPPLLNYGSCCLSPVIHTYTESPVPPAVF